MATMKLAGFFSGAVASILILMVAILLATRGMLTPSIDSSPPSSSSSDDIDHDLHVITVKFQELEILPLVDAVGPESIAFDPNGRGPYVGVSDGRIIRWDWDLRRWIDFAVTSPNRENCHGPDNHEETEHICGRPLGLRFNQKTGDLYIADAYMGLLVVGPNGGLATPLSAQTDEAPFWFTNGLDIDQTTGDVYFTASSNRYTRRNYLEAIISGDQTGKLMKYDPTRDKMTTLLQNLTFPNGVALSRNGDFILALESTSCRVLKYWLRTSKVGTVESLTKLPGFPDNIKMNSKGEFWVGMYSRRGKLLDWILSYPGLGEKLVNPPLDGILKLGTSIVRKRAIGMAIKLSEGGDRILQVLEERSGRLKFVSEVVENNGDLWFGSVIMPFLSVLRKYESYE
ncbi:hypothetical protein Dimus_029756 [Dionaea muscipula]